MEEGKGLKEYREQIIKALGKRYNPKITVVESVERLAQKCIRLQNRLDSAKYKTRNIARRIDTALNIDLEQSERFVKNLEKKRRRLVKERKRNEYIARQ